MLLKAKLFLLMALSSIVSSVGCPANGADWPQWHGPNRDAICSETGLLKKWPDGGPKLLGEVSGLGRGYSSVVIVDGKLFTTGDRTVGKADQKGPEAQFVLAYDVGTYKQLWAAKVGPPHRDGGPRSTPTVADGLVYAIGTEWDVVCVDSQSGRVVWTKNFQRDLGGGKNPTWKFSESPLVDGDKLLCTPGGREAVVVALNKKTGELIWKCSMPDIGPKGKDEAGYSSIVVAEAGGVRQYVQLTNKGLIGVSADNGRFLWGYNKVANDVACIPTALVHGEYVFCSTAYNTGSALLKLVATPAGIDAKEVYFLDAGTFQNHHGGFVRVGDYVYGGHGPNSGKPSCIQMRTGKLMWQEDQPGKGSACVLYADGNLYFRYEDNTVVLIEANPQECIIKGTLNVPQRPGMSNPGWAHPVIVDGRLYIRHADVLFCYDLKSG